MKSSKFIKLLSVLLCVVMVLSSCANSAVVPNKGGVESLSGTAGTIPSLDETNETPEVEPDEFTISDFVVIEDIDKVFSEVVDAPEGVRDVFENYLIQYDMSIDAMNKVTMKYELVNYETGEIIKTWECESSYEEFEKEYFVTFEEDRNDNIALVLVFETNYVRITEEMREENYLFDENSQYYTYTTVSVYDVYGNEVVAGVNYNIFENRFELEELSSGGNIFDLSKGYYMFAGNGNVYLFDQSGKFVKTVGAFDRIDTLCDFENDKYMYYLDAEEDWTDFSYVQVYEKGTGKLVYQMQYGMSESKSTSVFILNDGTLLVQSMSPARENEKYDCYFDGEAYVLDTYLYNVETGVKTVISDNYVFVGVFNKAQLAGYSDGVTLGDKFENMAMALEVVDKQLTFDSYMPYKVIFFDNAMNVQFVPENEVPFADAMLFESPYVELASGYKYVEVDMFGQELTALYNADGEFVRYLTAENTVCDYFIYNDIGIFSFDLEPLYSFSENETVFCCFGDSLIIERVNEYADDDEPKLSYYRLFSKFVERTVDPDLDEEDEVEGEEGEGNEGEVVEPETITVQMIDRTNFEYAEWVRNEGDFLVVYHYELETYNLFNRDFERIFVSMSDYDLSYNGYLNAYEMTTVIKGEEFMYIIK